MISSQPAPRVARNVAEKQRRDKLNAFISDLATHVPLVASATKRLDKTSILRLASCFLRLVDSPLRSIAYNWTSKDIVDRGFPSSPSNTSTATIPYNSSPSPSHWKAPKFLRSDHVKTLMEGLEGFLIVANCDLKLIYVAQTCEKFLGHQNIDMMGFPLTAFIHPGDVDAAKFIIETAKEDLLNSEKKESERVQVRCRMKERSQPRTEVVTYQMVQIVGTFILSNVDRDYNGFTNGQHTSSSSGINNLSVSNNTGNPTSDTSSAMNDTLPPSPCPSTSSSGIFSHCPSTSKGTKRKRGESIDSGLSELSCPSPSSSKKSCFPYSPSSVSETSCSMEFNLFPKSLSVPSPSSSSTTVIATTKSDTTSDPSSPTAVMACSPSFIAKNLLFKGFVQVIPSSPMAELSLIDANQEEYVTRLSLDGVLLYADHRISTVIGYMPDEVVGRSAYAFILVPDHVISLFAHKLMLSNSNGTGIIVHRLRKRTGEHVYLQSAGCLQYDRSTGQVDHFICVSRLLHEEEGDKERQKFIQKFTPHVSSSSPSTLYESLQLVIGPKSGRSVKYQSFVTPSASNVFSSSSPGSESREYEYEHEQLQQHRHQKQLLQLPSTECLEIESAHESSYLSDSVSNTHPTKNNSPLLSSNVHSLSNATGASSTVLSSNISLSPHILINPSSLPVMTQPLQVNTSPSFIPTGQEQLQQVQLLQSTSPLAQSVDSTNSSSEGVTTQPEMLLTRGNQGSDPSIVYVNLPPDASGILEDGSFVNSTDVIAVSNCPVFNQSRVLLTPNNSQQYVPSEQISLQQRGPDNYSLQQTDIQQVAGPTLVQFTSPSQILSSGQQSGPPEIRSILTPNNVILQTLRKHASNNLRYSTTQGGILQKGDSSVLTMSRFIQQDSGDMTGAIVFGLEHFDSPNHSSSSSSNVFSSASGLLPSNFPPDSTTQLQFQSVNPSHDLHSQYNHPLNSIGQNTSSLQSCLSEDPHQTATQVFFSPTGLQVAPEQQLPILLTAPPPPPPPLNPSDIRFVQTSSNLVDDSEPLLSDYFMKPA